MKSQTAIDPLTAANQEGPILRHREPTLLPDLPADIESGYLIILPKQVYPK